MKLYLSSDTDPSINLATEEILLKEEQRDLVFLYQNASSVIVGKHQNAMAEVNIVEAMENHIKVYRRLSGGGAVYHDEGNLNFCFIFNTLEGKQVDFKRNTRFVVEFLQHEGILAEFAGSNNLVVNGRKFSGNAEHIYKNRVLHHGTLLFSSNLEMLHKILSPRKSEYRHNNVLSKPWPVVNLSEVLPHVQSISDFTNRFINFLQNRYGASTAYFTKKQIEKIQHLAATKYQTWEWNYAYNAIYVLEKTIKLPTQFWGNNVFDATNACQSQATSDCSDNTDNLSFASFCCPVELHIERGVIRAVKIDSTLSFMNDILIGTKHHPEELLEAFAKNYPFSSWDVQKLKILVTQFF